MSSGAPPVDGRVALVTGSSRGIGREIAKTLAANGAHVVLTARTEADGQAALAGGLADAAAQIRDLGGKATTISADLSDAADRERLVAQTVAEVGPIDILINCAAVTYFVPVVDFPLRRYDVMFEVQVRAPFHLMQLVLPSMIERQAGWIVNLSSIVSRHPSVPPVRWDEDVNGTVYGACKAALERISTGTAAETFAHNVAVNSLAPNRVVPTPGTVFHGLTSETDPDAEPIWMIAQAALVLSSCDPKSMTGRVLCTEDVIARDGSRVH